MIISRTPYRVSFFGGGTDYPAWYAEHGGSVLSTAIDKYCYIFCRRLPPFFEHRSRIVYSQIETVGSHEDIRHPSVRECLKYLDVTEGIEIHHDGDLPARTGVGSSSSFTVGLLHALYALKGVMPSKMQLAKEAIHVEQNLIGETVGAQDQTAAAFGGLNRIDFLPDGDIRVSPVPLPARRLEELESHLLLVFTGFSRTASPIAAEQVAATPGRADELTLMQEMVDEALAILCGGGDITGLGTLLHESWRLKRSLTAAVSTPVVDMIYDAAMQAGAIGGKLLGAGGGGFALFVVRPEDRKHVIEKLGLMAVPFKVETSGSQIVLYQADGLGASGANSVSTDGFGTGIPKTLATGLTSQALTTGGS